ncbi:MAG: hypothetical protein GTO45_05260, partial [Candidatus Aminicenantes bacterium]|nr:hypothetical protein [Candidatus Aminicenantes bacterium]NIN17494.1 hypothetical protein [Candidatus Aminicenantes bacterium]NIN41380.1 hypothetical protein [Candidatus Aminicenantes bacterium]NIN84146.1 hypothetical protein [Candidatus Aminicenantes bacterium]NIO86706.1 hypothetical protein [Candidatus Aminicenantes bacterium]
MASKKMQIQFPTDLNGEIVKNYKRSSFLQDALRWYFDNPVPISIELGDRIAIDFTLPEVLEFSLKKFCKRTGMNKTDVIIRAAKIWMEKIRKGQKKLYKILIEGGFAAISVDSEIASVISKALS